MRRLATFVAILLLLTAAAPVLACITASSMSRQESACCRSMHGQCGEMEKMGCCRTEVRTDETPQMPAPFVSAGMQWVLPQQLVLMVPPPSVPSIAISSLALPEDYFPPGLLIARITVLRI